MLFQQILTGANIWCRHNQTLFKQRLRVEKISRSGLRGYPAGEHQPFLHKAELNQNI